MKTYLIIIITVIILASGIIIIQAQVDESLSLTELSPAEVPAGQESSVTVHGTNFGERISISLSGYGAVPTRFIDSSTVQITIPASLAAGSYSVTAARQNGETSSNSLNLLVQTQTENATPQTAQDAPSVVVSSVEPRRIEAGTDATITIIGTGFSNDLVVRLQGYGLLPTTFVNNAALTAQVPSNVAARDAYNIELINGSGQSFSTGTRLQIFAPQMPTEPPPPPAEVTMPTEAPPVNNQPLLQVSSFSVEPATINAGESASIHFTVTNRGTDTARAITVSLSSGSSFVPAVGQLGVALPDLAPGASASGQMNIVSSLSVAAGAVVVPLSLEYQNPLGEAYSGNAELSLMVSDTPRNSQMIVDAYTLEPALVEAGGTVTVRLTLMNLGDSTASQVMLHIGSDSGVLLPNAHGDTYPIGDIESRQHAPIELSMLVNSHVESGHQIQPITISYFQNGETHEISSNLVINVAAHDTPEPLLLLASYELDTDNLQPGSRFNLNITVENAGSGDAHNTLINYGAMQTGSISEDGSSSSATFAPVGTAGLDFVGDIASGAEVQSSQEFMVSGNLASGIYPLTISFDYTLPDGTTAQTSLSISLVVIMPPQIELSLAEGLPSSINVGDTVPITLDIINNGRNINLDEAVFTIENGEILDGASIPLEVLREGEQSSISGLIMASEEGAVHLTLTIHYTDELNQAQTLVYSYDSEAVTPIIEDFPVEEESPIIYEPVVEQPEVNWFGRVMMALLGLGS